MFRKRNFVLTTAAGLLIGITMFGTLTYMPTYMQMVTGVNTTEAGLLLVPMMGTMLVTSIVAGRAVSRTGRYKKLLVAGAGISTIALFLMSTMVWDEPLWLTCTYLAMGLGMTMQNRVLVVQNTFPLKVVGTATSSNNYFRQIGASLGAALVGSMFTANLTGLFQERLPADAVEQSGADFNSITPEAVASLPNPYHDIVVSSYSDALAPVLGLIAPLTLIAMVLLMFVEGVPLRTHIDRDFGPGEALDRDGQWESDYTAPATHELRAVILEDASADARELARELDAEAKALLAQDSQASPGPASLPTRDQNPTASLPPEPSQHRPSTPRVLKRGLIAKKVLQRFLCSRIVSV